MIYIDYVSGVSGVSNTELMLLAVFNVTSKRKKITCKIDICTHIIAM